MSIGVSGSRKNPPDSPFGKGGKREAQGDFFIHHRDFGTGAAYTCRSNVSAARKTIASSPLRPTSIIPTGSPSDIPHGTLIAGCPVMSNGQVLGIISNARVTYSSRLALGEGIFVAFSGNVGITNRSQSRNAASYAAVNDRTRFCAFA